MRHVGMLAHSVEGRRFVCGRSLSGGFEALGPHHHPDVTLDCIALGHGMPAWQAGDHAAVRAILAGAGSGSSERRYLGSSDVSRPP